MKKVLIVVFILLLLPALALFARGSKDDKGMEQEKPETKETMKVEEPVRELRVTFAWPTYLDPAVGSDFSSSSSFVNLYDTLVYPTPEGGVKANVAERWDTTADGLTWTFHLRKGVEFHDGSELTAEDVAFTMDRIIAIGEGYGYMFSGKVESTDVVEGPGHCKHQGRRYIRGYGRLCKGVAPDQRRRLRTLQGEGCEA